MSGPAIAIVVVLGVLLVAACAFLGAIVLRQRRALSDVQAAIGHLADGDLTAAPLTGAGLAVEPLARIVLQLRGALTEVESVKERLATGWREVNDVAWQMLDTSESTAAQVSTVASSAEQVSHNMHAIASATEELAATIQDVSSHASQASAVAITAAEQVADAEATVCELDEASRRVEKVVDLITSIAGQTQMLSLNATIEAARAGEAGRGFAIVAGEVKQLAVQTATATDNVSASVRAIQGGADLTSAAMSRVTQTISRVSDNQAAIAAAVEQQNATTKEIGRSSAMAAQGSALLAENVGGLLRSMRTAAYAGAQGRSVAGELAALEASLDNLLGGYTFERIAQPTRSGSEDAARDDDAGAVTEAGGITTVQHHAFGTGINAWQFTDFWRHSKKNVESDGTNAYCSMPDEVATLRFRGSRVRLFGFAEANHGMAAVSVDGGEEVDVDLYGTSRNRVNFYTSPTLARGEHTLTLRVTGEKNPNSRYIWISLEKAEIVN
jgi:methyl-accepting chemotaxis protein